ncbi:MAG: DEAD/DEAH box helicase family protein [Limnochordaceae bacterium]|nr:DEAD/DEAH box helicase family protein [Limnochordaceae bacterium]
MEQPAAAVTATPTPPAVSLSPSFPQWAITVPIMTFSLEGWSPFRPPRPVTWTPAVPISPDLPESLQLRVSRSQLASILGPFRHGHYEPFARWQLAWTAPPAPWHSPAPSLRVKPGGRPAPHATAAPTWPLHCLTYLSDRFQQAGVILYPHQLETAYRVVYELGGRAILADEVGLGKTVEAGLILQEYLLLQRLRRVLVLVPPTLLWQWFRELRDKFALEPYFQRSLYDWQREGILLASLDTARREPHRSAATAQPWDLVVVDEAHRLKNERTLSWQLVDRLSKRYLLLLTATPVHNRLRELHSLVSLLYPGRWQTWASFRRHHLTDERTPRQPQALQRLVAEVMIRHRHGPQTVTLPPRRVHQIEVHLTPGERQLYLAVADWVQRAYRQRGRLDPAVLSLITLQREVCSSLPAAALTLARIARTDPGDPQVIETLRLLLQQGISSKAQALLHLVRTLGQQAIVFTEYLATQAQLIGMLRQAGIVALPFDGHMSASRKEWVRNLFQQKGQVLVSTESGGEGINFQFCHVLVNYDLPWNPMQLEQRIGRLQRLGQTQTVDIYNLVTRDTIEEHIVYLLGEKIRLFERVVGELDAILGDSRQVKSFQSQLLQILADWPGAAEGRRRLDELAQALLAGATSRRQEVLEEVLS